jgi:two-component system, chemotaxis family, chemotaxis protein CheY
LFLDEKIQSADKKIMDKTLKILIVEDSDVQKELAIHRLASLGFNNVTGVSNGLDAIAFLEGNSVNLIISDWEMPGINGMIC